MQNFLKKLMQDSTARLCIAFLLTLFIIGTLVPWLPTADPTAVDTGNKFSLPTIQHWLGTDLLGRDIFARLLWGIRTSVFAAVAAMTITSVVGALYGALAGALRGRGDALLMRGIDVMMSFPSEVLILAVVGMMGPGLDHVILACVIAKWAWYARMMRGIVRIASDSHYVRFARIAGAGPLRILFTHLLPVAAGEFFVLMTLDTGSVILMLSALSFLGLGVQPPTPEWGMMLAETKDILLIHPWQMLPSGLIILLTVAAFNFLGDALRDALDSRYTSGDKLCSPF